MDKRKIAGFSLALLLAVSVSFFAFSKTAKEYLEEEALDIDPPSIDSGDYSDKDAGYFDMGKGKAAVCHGGEESIGCKTYAVNREGGFYRLRNPAGLPFGVDSDVLEAAHYLDRDKGDYLIVKFLGEMRLIKPEDEGDLTRFDVYSWIPADNYLDDISAGGSIEKCCSYTSSLKPSAWSLVPSRAPRETVEDCVAGCGIKFEFAVKKDDDSSSIAAAILKIAPNETIVKDISFSSSAVSEMEARRDSREGETGGTVNPSDIPGNVGPAGNICTPVIVSMGQGGTMEENPSVFTYSSYGSSFEATIQAGALCAVNELSLGFWPGESLSGEPEFEVSFLPEEISEFDAQGIVSKSVVLSEAAYPEKLYLAARLVNASGNEFLSVPVEFYFPGTDGGNGGNGDSGDGDGGDNGGGGETPPSRAGCAPCVSITGCLSCLDQELASGSFE